MNTTCCRICRRRKAAYAILAFRFAAFLAATLIGSLAFAASGPGPAGAPPALKPFLPPPQTQELAYVEVPPPAALPGTWVAAWAFRETSAHELRNHSRIIVVGPERAGGQPQVLWQSRDEELYDPKVTLERWLTFDGSPLILVSRHLGAAWEFMHVIGFSRRRPRLLDVLEAEKLKPVSLFPHAGPQILAYHRWYNSELPDVLEWNGTRFVQAWQKYPQYYQGLLHKHGFLRESPQWQPLEVAWLTARAGKRDEAVKILQRFRASSVAQGDRDVLKAIDQALRDPAGEHFSR